MRGTLAALFPGGPPLNLEYRGLSEWPLPLFAHGVLVLFCKHRRRPVSRKLTEDRGLSD